MNKTLTYSSFVITSMVVVIIFLTARTYTQLGLAVILYPILAYFAYKIFVDRNRKVPVVTVSLPRVNVAKEVEAEPAISKPESAEVVDIDKRTFLKLIGATGISFFIFSLLGRRLEPLIYERFPGLTAPATPTGPSGDEAGTIGVSPLSGYRISEIDDNAVTYYGFINNEGAWLIMREDTNTNSFRYARGESKFPANWVNRENLKYDYFHNLF